MNARDLRFHALAVAALAAASLAPTVEAQAWAGWTDRSDELGAAAVDFGAPGGGNENYYDGDFADFDGDFRMDRALISRFGLLWNSGGGVMVPVSTQRIDPSTGSASAPRALRSWTGYQFGDGYAGNDAVQWADVDGDGDPDAIQGGNGEPFVVQSNRAGRFVETGRYSGSALNIANIDAEGDGDVDLAVAHAFCSNRDCGGPVDFRLWVNDGNGNFTDETSARGLGAYRAERQLVVGVTSGDLDGDGDFDLVMLVGVRDSDRTPRNAVIVNENDGSGSFTERVVPFNRPLDEITAIGSGFGQLPHLGDVDDDGDLDLIVVGAPNSDPDTMTPLPVGEHPMVSHAIFINDGSGNLVEESLARWDVSAATEILVGGNGKLSDVDFDGDLDFVAFHKPGPVFFQVFLNDGAGFFTYRPDLDTGGWEAFDKLGVDVDVADLDGDGTQDLWIGIAKLPPNLLINGYRTPSGIRADLPRAFRLESAGASGVSLSWRHPPWASMNRHYRVLRSLASGSEPRDRRVLKVIARSPHEDDSFAAPLSRSTTTEELGDPDVELDGDRVVFTDRTAVPGVRYRYSVVHVGTERNASQPTWEIEAGQPHPDPTGPDSRPPELAIVSPSFEEWSRHPRIVLEHGDDLSGIDPASLEITFDQDLGDPASGGRPAGTDVSDLAMRRDETTWVGRLPRDLALPLTGGVTTLTARVRDVAGNEAVATRSFVVSVDSPQPPVADFGATERSDVRIVDLDGSASTDPDGAILRWEWSFGDGTTGIGKTVSHRYRNAGAHVVRLVVRDDQGGVDEVERTVTVADVDPDSDGDGLLDSEEIDRGLDPDRADTDADGVPDGVDCLALDALAGTPPEEITDLRVEGDAASRLTWGEASGSRWSIVTGELGGLRADGFAASATCTLTSSVPELVTSDPVPPSGAFWVVRAENPCGAGGWGDSSVGPRATAACD